MMPGSLMAGQRPLEPLVEVRVLPGQQGLLFSADRIMKK